MKEHRIREEGDGRDLILVLSQRNQTAYVQMLLSRYRSEYIFEINFE